MRLRIPWTELATLASLYVAISAFSMRGGAGVPGLCILAMALATALVPRAIARRVQARGWAREAALLAAGLTAVSIATRAAGLLPPTAALADVASITGGVAAGLALLLALDDPENTRPGAFALLVAAAGGVGAVSLALGPWALRGAPLVVLALASAAFEGRYTRTPRPDARARMVLPAVATMLGAALGVTGGVAGDPYGAVLVGLGTVVATAGLTAGAVGAWLDESATVARVAFSLAVGAATGVLAAAPGLDARAAGALGAIVALLLDTGLARAFAAPDGGRLMDACARARSALEGGGERLEDVATAVLDPLRIASRDLRAPAALFVLQVQSRIVLDVAGAAHVARVAPGTHRALLAWLRTRSGEVLFSDVIRPLEVRRPELRPVIASLEELSAFALVPLLDAGELIGMLVVPRGRRSAYASRGEARALTEVGRATAAAVARALSLERATQRARVSEAETASALEAEARAESARDAAVARARGVPFARAIGSLESAWVGYGPAMRALDARVNEVALRDGPVAVLAEPGTLVAAAVRVLHDRSPRAGAPCVLLDAGSVHPRDALATLLGDARAAGAVGDDETTRGSLPPGPGGTRRGVLELAGEGTLAITDLPALGYEAHLALLDALRTGRARALGSSEDFVFGARLVATVRGPLATSGLPAELCERLADAMLELPPLRSRPEDFETLVLFAIDRASRVTGHAAVGVGRDTLAALRAYGWPGNEHELFLALERAVLSATGPRIELSDLPPAVLAAMPVDPSRVSRPSAPPTDAAGESYDALERRILESALERASGNKSEAARSLGLARTTFLDKLRKHGLRD